MNQIVRPSQPLKLSPAVWMALALTALLGLVRLVQEPNESTILSYLEHGEPVVVRSSAGHHRFPVLGIELEISDGWTYLATAEDAKANAPTFAHPRSNSIVRLQPFKLKTWPPNDSPVVVERYGQYELQWVEVDDWRVGRLTMPPVDLVVVVITHEPSGSLNQAVREFCQRLQVIR